MRNVGARVVVTVAVAAAAFVAGYFVGVGERDEPAPVTATRHAAVRTADHQVRAEPVASAQKRRRADPEVVVGTDADPPDPVVLLPDERFVPIPVTVRDREGRPLPESDVELTSMDGSVVAKKVRTGKDGSVRADVGESVLPTLRRVRVRVSRAGYVARSIVVARESVVHDGVEIALDREFSVRGRCVDRRGVAVAGVRVVGPRGAANARTDEAGRFRLDLVETDAYVRCFPDRMPLAAVRMDLPAESGGVVDLGDVVLETGDVLRGRFLDAEGNPIAGARAHLVSRELEGTIVGDVAVTDAEGRFAVEHVGRGTYDLGLLRPGLDLDGGDLTNIVYGVRASEEVIVRAVRDHYVHVQFEDDDGEPVRFRGGRVTWFALDDSSDRLDWWGLGGDWDHFHIAARPGATYEVRIDLDGFEPATIRATATEARDVRADAVLRRKLQ